MNQLELLAQMVANMEGKIVTPQMAMMARDLIGYGNPSGAPELEMLKSQVMMLMLRDLGGRQTYSVKEIDTATRGKLMKMKMVKNQTAFQFYLDNKMGRG